MATWTLRHFSKPAVLHGISTQHLIRFLEPYRRYLISGGVVVPTPDSAEQIDYPSLIKLFLEPGTAAPAGLVDALYLVDEMATPEGMDALLAEVGRRGLKLDERGDPTPADVAVQVWLLDRDILERIHAESHSVRVRSFEYYQSDDRVNPYRPPSPKVLDSLTRDLNQWFESRKRGRGVRVIACDRGGEAWFLVRHGETLKREERLDGTQTSSICYRPVKYDVVTYSPVSQELRVHAKHKGELDFYRKAFGKHLFGSEDAFPGREKYTLDPLRELEKDALSPGDIDEIAAITLVEIQLYFGGQPAEIVTRRSDDLFDVFRANGQDFPRAGRMIRATFRIKFRGMRSPRTLILKPSNVAQYTRDEDGEVIERWLSMRGFIRPPGSTPHADSDPVLARRRGLAGPSGGGRRVAKPSR